MAAPATPLTETGASDRAADDYGAQGHEEWRDIDWRRHQRWVQLPGGPVNVIERGEGPPLVFVHGHSGRWANWLANIPSLSRRHRVIAMDLPGFGHSPMPREPITIENYGRTLDALMDRLDITAAPVVGNSMGGFAAAELAIKFPQRVERLILVSAAGLATKYLGLSTEFFHRRTVVALARAVNAVRGRARGAGRDARAPPAPAPPRPRRGRALSRAALGADVLRADAGLGQAGGARRDRRDHELRLPRPRERHRVPHADRVGPR